MRRCGNFGISTASLESCAASRLTRMAGEFFMWMEKVRYGVLEVHTDKGLCYLRPRLGERIRLLWTFRNFHLLPREVLKQRELTLVAALLERGNFQPNGDCRIGIVEWASLPSPEQAIQSPAERSGHAAPNTKPSLSATTPASNLRPRSRRRRRRKRSQRAATLQASIPAASPARAQ
jgi:hypothetical protein